MTNELIDLSALEEQMNSVNKEIEALKKTHIETSKKVFHGAVEAFFKMYPEVEALQWSQYTPYFNDGDSCEFSVNDLNVLTSEEVEGLENGEIDRHELYENNPFEKPSDYVYRNAKDEYYANQIKTWDDRVAKIGEDRIKELDEGVKKFKKIFGSISDDTMLSLFGDHVQITVTRKGIDVDEYDHE